MRTSKRAWLGGLALAVVACGGSGPSPKSLAATWNATQAEFVHKLDSSTKRDLVAVGGSVVLVLEDAGTFSITFSEPGEAVKQASGTWSSSVDVMTLKFLSGWSGEAQFGMSLSGDVLKLTGADMPFDFDGDEIDEPARLNLTLARQQ